MSFQPNFQPRGFDFLKDVEVRLSVELGRAELSLREVLALGEESVVMLDRLTDELLDVMVNGKIIARGEIVAQGNRFGLRIVELAGGDTARPATPDPAEADALRPAPAFDEEALNRAAKGLG